MKWTITPIRISLGYLYKTVFPLLVFVLMTACESFLTIDPPKTQIVSEVVFSDDATATSAIRGIYSKMISINSYFADGGGYSVTTLAGLSSDEFINYLNDASAKGFYENSILPSNSDILWKPPYQYIYYANSALEGLAKSTGVSTAINTQLTGEAKFIRAFCYFYLVNLYGEVPIITTTDYRINSAISRSGVDEVYAQIIADLNEAKTLLSNDYSFSEGERVRPNKAAATALLARVYLYIGDWANAEAQASSVINKTTQYGLDANLNDVFLKNSNEAIWQLMPVSPGLNTLEGSIFISTNAITTPQYISLRNDFILNAFEEGDQRKAAWVSNVIVTSNANTFYFPYKYKVQSGSTLTEYYMMLRLAEQYLIRAEARAQQNNISGAQDDINAIRNRAGLSNTTSADKASLLTAIEQERRIELFAEWGHRWLDLKRTNRADAVLSIVKGSNWQSEDMLYPIPQSERSNNINLSQNNGYK